MAYQTRASLIVVFSHTGTTTRMVAKYHPACPVLSLNIPAVHGGTLSWAIEGDVEARQQLLIRGGAEGRLRLRLRQAAVRLTRPASFNPPPPR